MSLLRVVSVGCGALLRVGSVELGDPDVLGPEVAESSPPPGASAEDEDEVPEEVPEALELPEAAGVVAVPASVFCDDAEASGMASVMRFAFCKKRSTIDEAVTRLVDTYGQRALGASRTDISTGHQLLSCP